MHKNFLDYAFAELNTIGVNWNIKMSAHYLNIYVEVNSLLFNYKVILYESLPLKKATAQEKGET